MPNAYGVKLYDYDYERFVPGGSQYVGTATLPFSGTFTYTPHPPSSSSSSSSSSGVNDGPCNLVGQGGNYERIVQATVYIGQSGTVQFNSSGANSSGAGLFYWRQDAGPPPRITSSSANSISGTLSDINWNNAIRTWDLRAHYVDNTTHEDRNPQMVRDVRERLMVVFERMGGGSVPDIWSSYDDCDGMSWHALTLRIGGAQYPIVRTDNQGGVLMAAVQSGKIVAKYRGPADADFGDLAPFVDGNGTPLASASHGFTDGGFDCRPLAEGSARWYLLATVGSDAAPSLWACGMETANGGQPAFSFTKIMVSGLTGGTRPVLAVQYDGGMVLAALTGTVIAGQYRPPGSKTLTTPTIFMDDRGQPVAAQGGQFALTFAHDAMQRLILSVTAPGDPAPSEWACADETGLTFLKLTGS